MLFPAASLVIHFCRTRWLHFLSKIIALHSTIHGIHRCSDDLRSSFCFFGVVRGMFVSSRCSYRLSNSTRGGKRLQRTLRWVTALQPTRATWPDYSTARYIWTWLGTFVRLVTFIAESVQHLDNLAPLWLEILSLFWRSRTGSRASLKDRLLTELFRSLNLSWKKTTGSPAVKEHAKVLTGKHSEVLNEIMSLGVPEYKHAPPTSGNHERFFLSHVYRPNGGGTSSRKALR